MNPIAAVLATVRIVMPSEGEEAEEAAHPRAYLPPIVDQLEAYRAAAEREGMPDEPLRQVDARLARGLGMTFEELKALVTSGDIPAAKEGRRGGLYVTTAALERWSLALRESHS